MTTAYPQVSALPEELYLEVSSRCNLRCLTCPQSWGMPEARRDMSWDDFTKIADQFPTLRRAVLHGIGEPLLNPRLGAMIAYLKGKGAHVLFNTNGILLDARRSLPLIEAGLDELRVSLDAADPATYKAVRGAPALPRILDNLRAFSRLKAEHHSARPALSLWLTGLKLNVPELASLVDLAADLEIREVHLQRLVWSERKLASSEQALGSMEDAALEEVLAAARERATQRGVSLSFSGALPAGTPRVDLPPAPEGQPWRACQRPLKLMYVTAGGNALPCCIAPFTDAPYEELIMGNVSQTPMLKIWRGGAYRRWRGSLYSDHPPQACSHCGVDWPL